MEDLEMKKILMITAILLVALGLAGCQAQDALSVFERAASTDVRLTDQYDTPDDNLNNETLNQLTFSNVQTLSLNLSSEEMTTTQKVEYIRSLFTEIQVLHAQNTLIRIENKENFEILKQDARTFRELDLTISQEDKDILLSYKEELTASRLEVKETIGVVWDLFKELKGKYNLENIDLVMTNFETIRDILQLRYDHMSFVKVVLADVNVMVLEYIQL